MRLSFLLLLPLLACQPSTEDQAATHARPNILWIVADDLGTDLGCYGEAAVHTPHLDRLAQEGVRYENLHTVTAVCSPSRSGLITGMYPVSIGCHQHRTQYKDSLPPPVVPLPELFRQGGYWVSNASQKNLSHFGKTDYNFIHDVKTFYDGPNWRGRAPGQPFFAQVQVFYPHRPFVRDSARPVDPAAVQIPPYYPDHPLTRADWAWYLETVQHVDQAVGELLDTLQAEGLLENTIVMFLGDQGRPHVRAKQFLYDPGTHTPLIIRWPDGRGAGSTDGRLVSNIDLAAASLTLAGIPIPAWMQGRDFLAERAPARGAVFTMRDRRDETVDRIRAVRTGRFKYIRNFYPERPWSQFNAYKKFRYPVLTLMEVMHQRGQLSPVQARFFAPSRPPEELYDLQTDPYEVHNLADDPAHADTLAALRQRLDRWLTEADRGQYPESPEEIAYAEQLMQDMFRKNMAREGLSPDVSDEAYLQWWMEKMGVVDSTDTR
ncbi:MAG: arylsulfatase [Bacteroidetes bacterium]|nr:MAG: arylsulfatase [Bacteroidota bacterium]